jgi:CTP synthase
VIHLTLVPYLAATGELKTKPTQHSVKLLLEAGVQPDILVLRTEHEIDVSIREKVALFCNVDPDAVVQSVNVPTIYEVPVKMLGEKLDITVMKKLGLEYDEEIDLESWDDFLDKAEKSKAYG